MQTQKADAAEQRITKRKLSRLIGHRPIKRATIPHFSIRHTEANGDPIGYVEDEELRLEDVDDQLIYAPQPQYTDKDQLLKLAIANPLVVTRELCKRDLSEFIRYFWSTVSHDTLSWNWHISYIADTLMKIAEDVAAKVPRSVDTIFNIPPGMTKSVTCSVMFPVWCWTRWPWMRFITASYSNALSLEQADYSRELIRSRAFRQLFPELTIKEDKDTKSNYRVQYLDKNGIRHLGGNRYSTSVGGTLTGFHGHILIVDDPINPREAMSDLKLETANHWMSQTLSTRKIDKAITPTILIMQRLHQQDPTGYLLDKKSESIRHICLPGEIMTFAKYVRPVELIDRYVDGLLDPKRLSLSVLNDLETDLGQYGYAGQIGQNPVPPGGGMFKVDHFQIVDSMPTNAHILLTVRYWDKAGSKDSGAYTAGVKACRLDSNKIIVMDVKRGQWATEQREAIIRQTAEADGQGVAVYHEQEPGSGGKDSAQATVRNLIGFDNHPDRPTGDKVFRADPYSVQVNNGNVMLLRGEWNHDFIEEHRFFPYGRFKDIVDAASGVFTKLAAKRLVRRIT